MNRHLKKEVQRIAAWFRLPTPLLENEPPSNPKPIPRLPVEGIGKPKAFVDETPQERTRLLTLGLVFVTGLVLMDQLLLSTGDRLIDSGKWVDKVYYPTPLKKNWETMVIGTCRAKSLDTEVFEKEMKTVVLNAGLHAESLGAIAFNLATALSHHHDKRIVLILDDWILATTQAEALAEINRRKIWWNALSPTYQQYLDQKFEIHWLRQLPEVSGFWKYRGRGPTLIKSLLGMPHYRSSGSTAAAPVAASADVGESKKQGFNTADFVERRTTSWSATAFSLSLLEELLAKAKSQGFRPVLVLPPLHRLRNTDEVNAKINGSVNALAEKLKIPFLSYLGNQTIWATDDSLWVDPGHFAPKGIRLFTKTLSSELRGAWK